MSSKKIREDVEQVAISDETLPISGVKPDPENNAVLVPVMEPEEVLMGVATRGRKMARVAPPAGVSYVAFNDALASSYAYYMRNGVVPSPNDLKQGLLKHYNVQLLVKVMESPQFRHALMLRGIETEEKLTPEQEAAISIMATPDGKPFETKLRKANVAPSVWRAWMRNKTFRAVWDNVGGSVLTEHENDMLVSLTGQALNGDVGAIKYALEVSGRHDPTKQQSIDATILIAQIIEIVQEEVKDTETLQRIAARMQMVGGTPAARRVTESARQAQEIEAAK